ncbi:hypothetical protein AgCh_028445 [Apium graveolens]
MVISFSSKDYEGVNPNHNEALVVTLDIFDNEVRRMLIDNGSSGTLYLPVVFGSAPNQVTHVIKFYIINTPSSNNGIIGRSTLTRIQAITSISHLKIKFSTPSGIGEVKGDYKVAERCYSQALVMAETHQENKRKAIVLRKQQSSKKHLPPSMDDGRKEVQVIESTPDLQATKPGSEESKSNQAIVEMETYTTLTQGNPTMLATSFEVYMKKNSEARIQQLLSNQDQAKVEAAIEIKAILINESDPSKKVKIGSKLDSVFRKDLLSLLQGYADVFAWSLRDMIGLDKSVAMHNLDVNPDRKPVKQTRRNFTPKRQKVIDEEVEKLLAAGIRMVGQCRDGYNQIKTNPNNIPKTVFITHRAVYAYIMFPFGLMNAGSTYHRGMNKIFKTQLGRNLESYVDDMIAKSKSIPGHIDDLRECFDNLRKYSLKLNPEKCTFGVWAGKFLGFMIRNRGIEANSEKIKAIQEMKAPMTLKDVQKLAGSLAALRRFISKLAERCLPFFDLLKGATNKKEVNWNPEWQSAFEEIKKYLSHPPILTKAQPGEPLFLYLSAGAQAVGAALIREKNDKHQLVYYGREIRVVTNQPPRKIIHKPDVSEWLVNWAVELSQLNLSFIPRAAIKAQTLTDFIIECNFPDEEPRPMSIDPETRVDHNPGAWALKAEYEALITGLRLSRTLRIQDLNIYSDSQIVVKQINGEYITKDPILAKYQALVQSYLTLIPKTQVLQIRREENSEADTLSKLVQNSSDLDCSVYFEELCNNSNF